MPDSTLKDSSAGVYPKPISVDHPNAGISKKACINKPYDFTFTIVVPDSILTPFSTTPVPLIKASIDTANAITNLPKGIGYKCNPPDCVYKKHTYGCLILQGTADNSNVPGDYKPVITLKASIDIGFPYEASLQFPGTIAPGEYILTLLSENNCLSATHNTNTASNLWYPSPNQGIMHSNSSHIENVKIYNLNGKLIYSEKEVRNNGMDLSQLNTEGIHIIHWIEDNQVYTQKVIIYK